MRITIQFPLKEGSYNKLISTCDGSSNIAFNNIVSATTKHYFEQINFIVPSNNYTEKQFQKVWNVAHQEKLPTPLKAREIGTSSDPDYEHLQAPTETCLNGSPKSRVEDQIHTLCIQLPITRLSPGFKSCRQSYLMPDDSGSCLHQDREHCEEQVSGSHCEDCPYCISMTQLQHQKLLNEVRVKTVGQQATLIHL